MKKLLLTIVGVCLMGLFACGQGSGIQLTLVGQRQAAMANAGTALPLDAASAWLNPAAMAFLERQRYIQIGGSIYTPFTSFLEAQPVLDFESMDTVSISPVYAYGVFRPRLYPNLTFGFSINSPYASASLWPDDWNGRFLSQEFRVNSLFFQPAMSIKLGRKSSFGFGLNYGLISLLNRKAIDRTGPMETRSSVSFTGQGLALGINLSLYHIYSEKLSFGLTLRSPMRVNINDGQATFDVPITQVDAFPNQNFSTGFWLPLKVNLGIAYKPEARLQLALDLRFSNWRSFDSLQFMLENPVTDLQEFPERAWVNTISFHGGMEYLINERLEIRAGLSYDNSPVPNDFLSPDLPDGDRIGVHAGLGVHILRDLILNAATGYNYSGERTGGLRAAEFGGIYESVAFHFGVELQFRL